MALSQSLTPSLSQDGEGEAGAGFLAETEGL
jgi:hypothetical protein